MAIGDLEQVLAIEKDAFPDLFPPTSFRSELKRPRAEYYVAHTIEDIESLADLEANSDYGAKHHFQYRSGYTGWQKDPNLLPVLSDTGKWLMKSTSSQ